MGPTGAKCRLSGAALLPSAAASATGCWRSKAHSAGPEAASPASPPSHPVGKSSATAETSTGARAGGGASAAQSARAWECAPSLTRRRAQLDKGRRRGTVAGRVSQRGTTAASTCPRGILLLQRWHPHRRRCTTATLDCLSQPRWHLRRRQWRRTVGGRAMGTGRPGSCCRGCRTDSARTCRNSSSWTDPHPTPPPPVSIARATVANGPLPARTRPGTAPPPSAAAGAAGRG